MEKLDLHGIKHFECNQIILLFIEKNLDNLPIEIITGNSIEMQNIVREITKQFNLKSSYPNYKNLGSLIITEIY
jgi:DNA-nicking Smr family endonuclease